MPLPVLPVFPSDDTLFQQSERYRHYLVRFRSELEGQEFGLPNLVEQGKQWGVFPPPAGNLIIDPGFELNRSSWIMPLGARYLEDSGALNGSYTMQMSSAEGYAGGLLIANVGGYTPCVASQLVGLSAWVVGATGTTGTAFAGVQFYDSAFNIVTTSFGDLVTGAGATLSTSWQNVLSKAVVPGGATYARFMVFINSLSGVARWDQMIALTIISQNELGESTGNVNFSSTTETALVSATFGPTIQSPLAGTASLLTPVIILANCAYGVGAGAGGNVTFRIRRTNTAGTQLSIAPNLIALNGTLCLMAFDLTPDVTAQTWVLTGQMADATGGVTTQHRIWASQHYV